jgi:hypothetical protein
LPPQLDRPPGNLPKGLVLVSQPPLIVHILTKSFQHSCAELAVPARDKLIPSLASPSHAYANHEDEEAEHEPFHQLHGSLL